MEKTNSVLLNRFFTRNTFKQIIEDGESPVFMAAKNRYIADSYGMTNEECIRKIYQHLKKEYQNEYYYKNTLLNKLLLGVYSPHTTTALTEVPIGKSKADFILINGKAIVYEIKTELDNLDRLDGQVDDYYKAFSRVIVVTSEKNYDEVRNRLSNSSVGICLLTKRGTLSFRKEPIENKDMLSKSIMFKMLRKNEFEKIILNVFHSLPDVSQFEYYRACQALFESLPTEVAFQQFVQTLKHRAKVDIVEYERVPYELKFIVYFSNYKKRDYKQLYRFLST